MYDLCIIGGGAAGMSCAIAAGRNGKKILIIEKNSKLGKKLYATGNGKCNLTNTVFAINKHYNSSCENYEAFISDALKNSYNDKAPNHQLLDFVKSIGVNTIDDNNYIYPRSAQASSVVWALIDELKKYDIEIRPNMEVLSIEGKSPSFTIKCDKEAFNAAQIVLANGGLAYKALGGTDSGYKLSKKLGHNIIKPRPSLCGIFVSEDISMLAGVRANANISLISSEAKTISCSQGELQFSKEGLSGICIFQLSSKVGHLLHNNNTPRLRISLLDYPNTNTYNELIATINSKNQNNRTIIGLLNGFINDKLANYICEKLKINGKQLVKDTSINTLINLADNLKALDFTITDLYNMEQAQVTAGGVDINEINPYNMESKHKKGVYIVGELLDIDGICGGYNLTFAMLTGYKAGKSII